MARLASMAPHRASADEPEAIRVEVHEDVACADTSAFGRQITGRTPLARIVATGAVRTFTVRFTRAGRRVRGSLTIASPSGSTEGREVTGSCEDVVSALGLVAALAVDPHATTVSKPPAPTPPVPVPPTPPPPPPPLRLPPMPAPRPLSRTPWWGPIGDPLPVLLPARGPRWRGGLGATVEAEGAVAPSIVPVGAGFVDLERVDAGLWSPSFRLGFVGADSGTHAVGAGNSARFRVLAARLEACPLRLGILEWLAASPCVRLEAGELSAFGSAGISLSANRPWLTPGLLGRLGAEFPTGEDARWFRVELEGGMNVPTIHDTFSFGAPPSPQIAFRTPSAGGVVGASVSAHFP